jgi:hypothetical protein
VAGHEGGPRLPASASRTPLLFLIAILAIVLFFTSRRGTVV